MRKRNLCKNFKKKAGKAMSLFLAGMIGMGTLAGCGQETQVARSDHSRDTNATSDSYAAGSTQNSKESLNATSGAYYYGEATCDAECCYDDGYYYDDNYGDYYDTSEFDTVIESGFCDVLTSPLSTFGADVDTASYSTLRSYVNWGYGPDEIPTSAIRTEELLNYFSYDYEGPKGDEPFGVNAEIIDCPWNENSKLLMLGLQTEAIDFSEAPDSNIVFLIDVSGSMYDENKLPLLVKSFELLCENLTEKDRVSIVTYAGSDEIVLEGCPGNEYGRIAEALEGLEAGGCTNGGQGIISAYNLAEEYFIKGGNNRVILATDGDFNVGVTSNSDLYDLIDEEKKTGVFLSVLGFGMWNYSDSNMETLADHGNGNYAYIDSLSEAKKVLVEEMGATLVTVAKDVKLQVEFNPAFVSEYRLIGYENRMMAAEDFDDDTKDGGEIGAGHSVTVMYELVMAGEGDDTDGDLKYQTSQLTDAALNSNEWLTLSIRYKDPDEDTSKLLEYPIGTDSYTEKPSDDIIFAADVVEFSMLLRQSEYAGSSSYKYILSTLEDIDSDDEYKQEFYDMVYTLSEY